MFLFEENFEAAEVFVNMATQWNMGGMGTPIGLNYSSLDFVMKTLRIKKVKECFSKLRVIEMKSLELFKKGSLSGSTT